jgi:hypothetical protein
VNPVTDDRDRRPAWYVPSVADLVFVVVALVALRRGSDLLNDPGTPWHIRVGQHVLESGPPHTDTFSFTRAGEPWLSQAWLCDAVLAWLYDRWSWNGVVVAAVLVLAWTYRELFRAALGGGSNVAWSVALTLLAAAAGASHWLVRSHLVSLLFFLCTLRWCLAYHRTGSRWVWAIPPLVALWSNVHGGFLAGLIVVGCSIVGHALTGPRDATYRRRLFGLAAVLVLASIATLVNPYGWTLHAHLRGILITTNIRDLIDEWRAPDFQSPDARPFELLLLWTLIFLATGWRRISWFSLIHLVVWFHFAIGAVRQVAFAAIAAVIVLAELTPDWWRALRDQFGLSGSPAWFDRLASRVDEWTVEERSAQWPVWSCAVSFLLVAATLLRMSVPALGIGMARPSESRWPIAAVAELAREPATAPLFHDLNWGGYLILHTDRPVFIDDRFELYRRDFLVAYLDALQAGPAWSALDSRYRFQHALIRPDVPLARMLRESADWEVAYEDTTAVLLRRKQVRIAGVP